MQTYLLLAHSLFRWFIIIVALISIAVGIMGMQRKDAFRPGHKLPALLLLICCDIQLLIGLYLYVANGWWQRIARQGAMKDTATRFYGMEHGVGMVIALILVHLAYSTTKKNIAAGAKYKRMCLFTVAALVIIVIMVPWPGRTAIGRPMFSAGI